MNGITIDLKEVAKRIGAFKIQILENGVWTNMKYGDMDAGTFIGRDGAETDLKGLKSSPKYKDSEFKIVSVEL